MGPWLCRRRRWGRQSRAWEWVRYNIFGLVSGVVRIAAPVSDRERYHRSTGPGSTCPGVTYGVLVVLVLPPHPGVSFPGCMVMPGRVAFTGPGRTGRVCGAGRARGADRRGVLLYSVGVPVYWFMGLSEQPPRLVTPSDATFPWVQGPRIYGSVTTYLP